MSITINLAPMIDMTFLLLIFFLVTTSFERAEGILASELPRESARPAVALPVTPIVVRLSPLGVDPAEYQIRIDRFENAPENAEELVTFLSEVQRQPGFDAETPIVIVADNAVRWDAVVECWNAALRAGCKRIAFAEP